ncbi:DUF5085 family protein [Numidum massiliense]|uniref:DUF5085 family protein n=1 Tax=Numidum massiliense TaxID=1522315 RepID=UPI0006D5A8B8|nr:DUF5085 family protein [Numidum massiliense]
MKIEQRPLIFDNVIVYETRQLKKDWQEGIFILEDFPLTRDIYQNGPVFFSVSPEDGKAEFVHFTYYLPINVPISLSDETHFRFEEQFRIDDALVLRQADEAVDFYDAYDRVKQYASEQQIELEDTYYCVLLKVFDDIIIDLYVPIRERGDQS